MYTHTYADTHTHMHTHTHTHTHLRGKLNRLFPVDRKKLSTSALVCTKRKYSLY